MRRFTRLFAAGLCAGVIVLALSGCNTTQNAAPTVVASADDVKTRQAKAMIYMGQAGSLFTRGEYILARDFYKQAMDLSDNDSMRSVWINASVMWYNSKLRMPYAVNKEKEEVGRNLSEIEGFIASLDKDRYPQQAKHSEDMLPFIRMSAALRLKDGGALRGAIASAEQFAETLTKASEKAGYIAAVLDICNATNGLAQILILQNDPGVASALEDARRCGEKVVKLVEGGEQRYVASAQRALGMALRAIAQRQKDDRLMESAIAAFRKAMAVIAPDQKPLEWALTQEEFALAMAQHANQRKNPAMHREAADAFAKSSAAYRVVNQLERANVTAMLSLGAEAEARKLEMTKPTTPERKV